MGMGVIPCHAHCVQWSNIRQLCPRQAAVVESLLQQHQTGFGGLARLLDECHPYFADPAKLDLSKAAARRLKAAWKFLALAFQDVTMVAGTGLTLYLGWYEPELGDRYDEIDGDYYFAVDGTQQLTPAGEKFKDLIELKSWTIYS